MKAKVVVIVGILLMTFPCFSQRVFKYEKNDVELIYFGKRYSYMMPHVIGTFDHAIGFHKDLWNYDHKRTHVLLTDFSDFGHGGATVLPFNHVVIGIEPYSFAFTIVPSAERFQWLFNHELTHITMADKANSTDEFWRKAFLGKVMRDEKYPVSALWSYLTVPRWYSPRWYHEGIACFMETWMSGGLGRGLGNYDEMYFRSIVAEKEPLYSVVGLETEGTTIDFQVGANSYLYGTRFVGYIAQEYGVDKLIDFYSRSDSSKTFYGSQFKNVYGKSIHKAWKDWTKWEVEFQQKNLDAIREYPETEFHPISQEPLGNVSKLCYNPETDKIYAALNYPGKLSQFAEIDRKTGKISKIANVDSPTLYYTAHMAYDPTHNRIFSSEQNKNYRSLVVVDVETGKKKTLIKYTRTGEFAYNKKDNSVWGIQHNNGYAILVKIPEPYDEILPMYSEVFGKSLFDVAISNDGSKLLVTQTGSRGEMQLIQFSIADLENGIKKYSVIKRIEDNTLTQFRYSSDDKYVIGVSYYTGVANIWRINLQNNDFELLSNTETGFFSPVQIDKDSLMVLEFKRDGMIPGVIPIKVINDANSINYQGNLVYEKNPKIADWALGSPERTSNDSIRKYESPYQCLKETRLVGAYPDITGYKNTAALGYRVSFRDPVGFSQIDLFLGTSPWSNYANKQKIHASLNWKYWGWNLIANYNKTDFYDLFGPTKRSRAGYSVGLKYERSFIQQKPLTHEFKAALFTYGDLEVIPSYQNISSPIKNIQAASVSYNTEKLRKTLGGVIDEQGFSWTAGAEALLAAGKLYPQLSSDQSFGFLVPGIRNTSFWIRNSIGQSLGDRSSVLSNFYFGGFRNNFIDWQEPEQYRKTLAFAGAAIDAIPAHNYVKTMGELNLKPIHLRDVGFAWGYPTYIKSSIFATHLICDFDKADITRNIFNFGTQVDVQLVMFSYLKTTWSAGYAIMAENGKLNHGQLMLSLKLLGN